MRRAATTALGALALLMTAGIVLQVFFAGLGIFGTEGFDTHTSFGWILHTIAVLMLVLAVVGPRTGRDIGMAAALVVLMTVQIMLSNADAAGLAALHPTLALFVLGLAAHIGMRHRPGRVAV
jgi:hypothetical protein